MASQGALRGYHCGDSISGTSKGYEESIALRVDLVTMILVERGTQEAPALAEHLCVALTHLLKKRGGPLNVGEEQGHGASWKVRHRSCPSSGFGWVS